MPRRKSDPATIRAAVQARAAELGLTAYALAKLTDGAVSDDTLRHYLAGTRDLTGEKLEAVAQALGVRLSLQTG